MKRTLTILSLLFFFLSSNAQAQTWNEWFRQKRTQRKYLVKQIALLKVYLGYVKKGYTIAQHGLTLVHDIKDGEFNLHRNYFTSLKNVNPHVANSVKVMDVVALHRKVVQNIRLVDDFCNGNENFTIDEVRYVNQVVANVETSANASIEELYTIVHADQLQMTDNERISRIDLIYYDMVDKHSFVKSFESDVLLIASEREREKNAIGMMTKQHSLN